MKKSFLLASLMACLVFGYAQTTKTTKYGRVENAGSSDARLKALLEAKKNQEPIRDCGDEHLGRLAFHNKSAKTLNLDLYSSGGNGETIKVMIAAGESVYVNDMLVGEYKYKKSGEKKAKKKDFVNVQECTLKVVSLEK